MSIVIALIVVLVVGGIIANLYPKPNKPTLAQGEILIPEPEVLPEPVIDVVESTPEVVVETPKMATKPKKKPQHKKKPVKTKTNA